MPGAGWSNASSPGFSGAGACWSAGSSILKTFSVSFNSLAYLSSSGNFEIGSSEARALMLAMYFNGPSIELSALEGSFERILDAMGLRLPAPDRPQAFRRSLKELEGSVLAIEKRSVRFSNPGVRDFLDRVVEDDRLV